MKSKSSFIILNPKIDSKKQRRLQCSVNLEVLKSHIKNYKEYIDFYKEIQIDIKIKSSKRVL